MPGKKTLSDSENENGSLGDYENELQKLQRQYRSKENERKTLYLEAQETTRKQKLEIESLEKERNELELTMRSLKSSTHQRRQKKHFEELKSLSSKNDDLVKFIEKEKQKQQEIDRRIEEVTKTLSKMEEQRQASKESLKKDVSNQKKVKKLEDQLQLANTKFCKLLESNKDLRQEIQSLRTQRQRFDELFERVEKEKHNLQSEVTEVIKQSTQAHEERNEAHEKLAQLREKSEKEEQRFDADMKQLERNVGESRKLLAFVGTVGKDRDEDAEMRRLREKREALLLERRKLLQKDDLETFKDSWGRITKVTQEEDVDAVISRFLEVEEENFAMFNFVNNQSSTIEQLQEEISSIEKNITGFEEGSRKSKDVKSSATLSFERNKKEVDEIVRQLDDKLDRIVTSLDKIKGRISSISEIVGCGDGTSKFGFDEGITDKNCLGYLATIEGRTDRMILERSFEADKQSSHDEELLPASNQIATFREDGDASFDGDDDNDHIGLNLPSMRDKQAAFGSARGFLTMDTTMSTLKSFDVNNNDDDDDDDDDLPQALDNIKSSTIQTIMKGNF